MHPHPVIQTRVGDGGQLVDVTTTSRQQFFGQRSGRTLGNLDAGHRVFITINNKAEGSAPASVRALAEALDAPPGA